MAIHKYFMQANFKKGNFDGLYEEFDDFEVLIKKKTYINGKEV